MKMASRARVWLVLTMICQACSASAQGFLPPMYSAREIWATIVAEDTRQPLEGVVVVAPWVLYRAGLGHGGHGPVLHIAETVTNAQGEFVIMGWGPRLRPPLTHLDELSPEILLFKHDFLPLRLHNGGSNDSPDRTDFTKATTAQINYALFSGGRPAEAVQDSFWNRQVLQLPPFRGTPEGWFRRLEGVTISVHCGDHLQTNPRATARLFAALLNEKEYFRQNPLSPDKIGRLTFESLFVGIERQANRGRQ